MSAAEPAHPNGPDRAPLATVHPFEPARPRRHRRSERTSVPAQPERPLTAHEKLAAHLESAFARHRRSLTDESTAQDFLITLNEVRITLHGALDTGLLDQDQHDTLDAMFEAMQGAPGLLTT